MTNKKYYPSADNLSVLKETDDYQVVLDPDCDMFSMIDNIPNYFLLSKRTGKIEVADNSEAFIVEFMQKLQEYHDVGQRAGVPRISKSEEVH